MRIILIGMIVVFTAAGFVFFIISLRELMRKLMTQHRFERTEGVVLHVQRKVMRSINRRRFKPTVLHMPVIRFTTRTGQTVTFTSETGDTGEKSRYLVGKHIPIRYDPLQEFVPMIDDWWGIWLPTLVALFAGVGFLAGAVLIGYMFGERILGR